MGAADVAAARGAAARAKAQEAAKKVIRSGGTADRAQQAATDSRLPQKTNVTIKTENKRTPTPRIEDQLVDVVVEDPDTNTGGTSEPIFELPPPPPQMVRVPERDVVSLAQETVSAETITNLLFENIGANELTKFVRHDTVEGINQYYDIISNLSDIKRKFDPSNLISLQKTTSSLFDIFPIKLQDKIPSDAYLSQNNLTDFVYIDTNGDLVIEVDNLKDSEIVEIEIDTSGTIYEVDES
jgi:hypothetical protein